MAVCSKRTILAAIRRKVDLRESSAPTASRTTTASSTRATRSTCAWIKPGTRSEAARSRTTTSTASPIGCFWGYTKTCLVRFRSLHPHNFLIHLKEYEFRDNHRHQESTRHCSYCAESTRSAGHDPKISVLRTAADYSTPNRHFRRLPSRVISVRCDTDILSTPLTIMRTRGFFENRSRCRIKKSQ